MPPLVDVVIEDEGWNGQGLPSLAERAARAALDGIGFRPEEFAIACLAAGDAQVAALNGSFRGKATPTNVLSWPSEERGAASPGGQPRLPSNPSGEEPLELGDIALGLETCLREAAEAERTPGDHLSHLIVHATLHLLGYDHETEEDAALMEGMETRVLAGLGIADPYAAAPEPVG